jgi:predicted NAD/FAD-binding protein
MKKHTGSSSEISRRQALVGAGLGAVALTGCGSAQESGDRLTQASSRPRVAIIGGGAGGVASAYFLEGSCDVTLFESRPKIGGHCDSQLITYQGPQITVDLGAQFFHPATHPIYTALLEQLGLYDPAHPDSDQTLEATGSVCVFAKNGFLPRFSSTAPYLTPFPAVDFLVYAQFARQVILQNQSWEMTLSDFIGSLPVAQGFKDSVLFPWLAALIGTTHENAARSSARSILQTFALAFPANPLQGASTYNSKIGLEGNLQTLLAHSPSALLQVNAGVQGLEYNAGAWTVHTASGSQGPFDAVVMNAPPSVSSGLLSPLPWAADIVGLLNRYEYFDTRIVIHTDPVYAESLRSLWAVYNGEVDGAECEGSVWLGGIHDKLPSGATLDVFKSWATHRSVESKHILLQRNFRHPLITPDVIRATRSLAATQGRNGLYFAGQHTTGFDLQEAAVYSAMKVADHLAPTSSTLAALRARLASDGQSGISYDL